MKAVIPVAGKGTRLRPHTHHTPKPVVKVAGRPVLSYLIDELIEVGVEEIVFIVGHLREAMEGWLKENYPTLKTHYVLQEVQDGTAGAVALAEPYIDSELFVIFAYAVFEVDYGLIRSLGQESDALLWAKEVEDYQRYGVIVTNDDGSMQKIVEKPSEPVSKLANIGLYYIRNHELLFEGIRHTLASPAGPSGEFYLTDAFQYMVDQGARLLTAPVDGWWDCGKPETLLETNHHLLEVGRGGVDDAASVEDSSLADPVRVEAGAVVRGSSIGPNVTIEAGATVENSTIRDSVIGAGASVKDSTLNDSLIGAHAEISAASGSLRVTDHSYVAGEG